ncbi:hypothetical protein CYY_006177 [Polysphondylium violaceum]|uniref:C-type lectin domain-containing protein n=1 Tax=Polysphondylium violaceum TaxID=133409 RepID=A0A8J4UYC4_9MYCE|nr:hypothetical protein CYY_006177 [Polysphondylium violaceum]
MKAFCIFAVVVLLKLVQSQQLTLVLNQENRHYYAYSNTKAIYQDAINVCQTYTPPDGFTGYLVTVTSKDEHDWIGSHLGAISSVWIAGSDLGDVGNWTYNVGPEKGQIMYDLYSERTYTFTNFPYTEPNFQVGENYLVSNPNSKDGWNNVVASTQSNYICEFSPIDEPFIPTVHSEGDMVTVNVSGYDIATLEIKFTSVSQPNFNCQNIKKVGENAITCQIPSGTGKYSYTLSDKVKSSKSVPWQYHPPHISVIVPSLGSGSTVTLVGDNFGNDASKIQITLDITGTNTECNNINIITPFKKMSCSLKQLLPKILPFQVVVNSISSRYNKTSIYHDGSKSIFYISFYTATKYSVMLDYSKLTKVDGNTGYLSSFDNEAQFKFVKQYYPLTSPWYISLGIKIETIDPLLYFYTAGPSIGGSADNFYYKYFGTNPDWMREESYVTMDFEYESIMTQTIEDSRTIYGGLIEFGGYLPTVRNYQTPYLIDTDGGTIFVQLDNFGTSLSYTSVQTTNLLSFSISYYKGGISMTISHVDLVAQKIPIKITIDHVEATPVIYYDRSHPSITNIKPSIDTAGGVITITGASLFNQESAITVKGIVCHDIQFTTPHKQFTCSIGPGTGMKSISIDVGGKVSNTFNYNYQDPTITSIPPIPTSGGIVTIQGTNFGIDKTAISINQCTNIEIITPHTTITCEFNQGQGDLSVTLTMGTYSTPPFKTRYQYPTISNIIQTIGNIDIIGDNFGWDQSKLIIKMDNYLVIGSSCTLVSNTNIKCNNLATVYGPFSISNDNGVNFGTTYNYDLKPQITSTFEGVCFNPQEKLTIKILYMISKSSTFKIKYRGQYYQVNILDSFTSEFIIPDGSGIVPLQFETDNTRLSNEVSISYCPTVIKSIDFNIRTRKYEITGTGFSSNSNKGLITSTNGLSKLNLQVDQFNSTFISIGLPMDAKSGLVMIDTSYQLSNKVWINITPEIESASNPLEQGSPITITGKYFKTVDIDGNNVGLEFSINGNRLTCEAGSNETSVVCQVPPGSGKIIINVKSLSAKNGESDSTDLTLTYIKSPNNNNSSNSESNNNNSHSGSTNNNNNNSSNGPSNINNDQNNSNYNSWKFKAPLIVVSCLLGVSLSIGVFIFLRSKAASDFFNRFRSRRSRMHRNEISFELM